MISVGDKEGNNYLKKKKINLLNFTRKSIHQIRR